MCVPNSDSTSLKVFPDSAAEWKYPLENRMLPAEPPTPFSRLEVIHVPLQLVMATIPLSLQGPETRGEILKQEAAPM